MTIRKEHPNMARGVVWDLSELYPGDEDPKLAQDLKLAQNKARDFVSAYKGKLNDRDLDVSTLLSAIQDYESIHEMAMNPFLFAYLNHSSNTQDHARNRLFHKVREKWNEISQLLSFFSLDITALPEGLLKELANNDDLSYYRHFLLKLIQRKPYDLSEPEEWIIKGKDLTGRKAFESLYDELIGSLSFTLDIDGKNRHFNTNQVLAALHSPDRSLREKVFQTFFEELGKHGMTFKHILNALILDYHKENVARGHPSPMHKRHLSNEVDETIIEAMMGSVEDHYALAERYFRLKGRLLGLECLRNTDLFAPIQKKAIQLSFPRARQVLLGAMEDFHPLFHSTVHEFFERNRLDAEARKGKQEGAFCKCLSPTQRPYISMHYNGDITDILTMAHELGHGIHYILSSTQSYLNFNPSPILAETASAFSEILVTRYLMAEKAFKTALPSLMASHMEGILTAVFRQNALTRFEQAIHHHRQDHLLSEQEICHLWWEENRRLFGKDVEMMTGYQWGWTYIPHFVHRPFYCYSYIFGGLVSIILFQNYMEKGDHFVGNILNLFSSGSSRPPLEMLSDAGLNPGDKSFWDQAFQYIGGLIDSLETF